MEGLGIGRHIGRGLHLDVCTRDRVLEVLRLCREHLEGADGGTDSKTGNSHLCGIDALEKFTEGSDTGVSRLGKLAPPFLRSVGELIELVEIHAKCVSNALGDFVARLSEILQLFPRLLRAAGQVSGISLEDYFSVL